MQNDRKEMSELQNIQLYLLKKLKEICEKNDIRFFLAYGTCLGAVRHKGFIPWDDDVDVYMPISDYEKFTKLILSDNLFIQTQFTDKEYALMIARLRIGGTTLIEADESDRDIHHGIFIDIYPLFSASKSKIKNFYMIAVSYIYRLFLSNRPPLNRGKIKNKIGRIILKITPSKLKFFLTKKIYKLLSRKRKSDHYLTFYGDDSKTLYKKEWFSDSEIIDFEGEKMPIPIGYDFYLKLRYGDYMTLPPKDKQIFHHNYTFIDFDTDYKNYKGTKYLIENHNNEKL